MTRQIKFVNTGEVVPVTGDIEADWAQIGILVAEYLSKEPNGVPEFVEEEV